MVDLGVSVDQLNELFVCSEGRPAGGRLLVSECGVKQLLIKRPGHGPGPQAWATLLPNGTGRAHSKWSERHLLAGGHVVVNAAPRLPSGRDVAIADRTPLK